jgi:hypothetical protein
MLREDKESFSLNQLWVISGPTKSLTGAAMDNAPKSATILGRVGPEFQLKGRFRCAYQRLFFSSLSVAQVSLMRKAPHQRQMHPSSSRSATMPS